MKLGEILNNISYLRVEGKTDRPIDLISSDSRFLSSQTLFIVKEGHNFSGIDFIKDVKPHAVAFIAEGKHWRRLKQELQGRGKTLIMVPAAEKAYRQISFYFLKKASRVKTVGITGTNGKTTTAYLLWHILNYSRRKSSLISTVKYILPLHKFSSFLTTPDLLTFANLMLKTYEAGGRYLISEISSHALAQGRIQGIALETAVFTNLTEDHLDYHKSMEGYFQAKRKIFGYLRPGGTAWLNADDIFCQQVYKEIRQPRLSFGLDKGDLHPQAWRADANGIEMLIEWEKRPYFIRSKLKGKFNIYNILTALGCAFSLGIKPATALEAIKTFSPPPGRMEEVKKGVFVDYAHTPDALGKVLVSLKQDLKYKKIILVFGCGGEREKEKRPLMGKIASLYSDYCIVTNDNPRGENPFGIIKQIVKGLNKKKGCLYEVIPERKEAIKKALKIKKDKFTVILIAGKGHESYQIIGRQRIKFSDRQVVKEY